MKKLMLSSRKPALLVSALCVLIQGRAAEFDIVSAGAKDDGRVQTRAPDAEPNDGLLVENCAFGPQCTGCLTLGSECFAAKDIIMRNCRVSNPTCVLRLKMRPDTRQIYSNVTVKGITGTCGHALIIAPYMAHARPDWKNQRLESMAENIRFVVGSLVCRSGTSSVTPSADYRLVNVRCE